MFIQGVTSYFPRVCQVRYRKNSRVFKLRSPSINGGNVRRKSLMAINRDDEL